MNHLKWKDDTEPVIILSRMIITYITARGRRRTVAITFFSDLDASFKLHRLKYVLREGFKKSVEISTMGGESNLFHTFFSK